MEISEEGDTTWLEILVDDAKFTEAVHKYKNIVTHYLASKMEIWCNHFMGPVYGLLGGNTSMEFTHSRGAIHYHNVSYSDHPSFSSMQQHLRVCAEEIAAAIEPINSFIADHYNSDVHSTDFPKSPALIFNGSGFQARGRFMESLDHPDAKQMWFDFLELRETKINACGKLIGDEFEYEFGLDAMHTGNFPFHWVRPGGFKDDNDYPPTSAGMQSSADVIAKRELKLPKFEREKHLYERHSNIINHAFTHKCSKGYCGKQKNQRQKYNPAIHKESDFGEYLKKVNDDTVAKYWHECRMGFGELLKFEKESGENNTTRGKAPVRGAAQVEMDVNGQPKFVGKRNHPRVVQAPYGAPWFGANNDTQFMLINATSEESWTSQGGTKEGYEKFANNLSAAGVGGLEHHNGALIVEEYVAGYQCKGDKSSAEWEASSRAVTEEYCNREGNAQKTVASLISKQVSEITGGMSESKDKGVFLLAKGLLKRSLESAVTKKCSVSSEYIEHLGNITNTAANANDGDATAAAPAAVAGVVVDQDEEEEQSEDASFTWSNITKKYIARSEDQQGMNLY